MATKHEELLESIGNMTVLELSEFVEAFKDKFNVTAVAAPVAMPGAAGGDAAAAISSLTGRRATGATRRGEHTRLRPRSGAAIIKDPEKY